MKKPFWAMAVPNAMWIFPQVYRIPRSTSTFTSMSHCTGRAVAWRRKCRERYRIYVAKPTVTHSQIFNLGMLNLLSRIKFEALRIEIQLILEGALDGLSSTKAMLLAFK